MCLTYFQYYYIHFEDTYIFYFSPVYICQKPIPLISGSNIIHNNSHINLTVSIFFDNTIKELNEDKNIKRKKELYTKAIKNSVKMIPNKNESININVKFPDYTEKLNDIGEYTIILKK